MNMDLEERIQRLEDIEAIRCLQAKYQRCLDTRDFVSLSECFAEDAVSSYDGGRMTYKGRGEIIAFLRKVMTLDMPSSHLIHGGEIDVQSADKATAKWYLEDYLLHQKYKVKLHGAAVYDVSYVKRDGVWQIKTIGYERCYEYFEFRGLLNQLTLRKKTFLDKVKKCEPSKLGKYGQYFQFKVLKKKKKD